MPKESRPLPQLSQRPLALTIRPNQTEKATQRLSPRPQGRFRDEVKRVALKLRLDSGTGDGPAVGWMGSNVAILQAQNQLDAVKVTLHRCRRSPPVTSINAEACHIGADHAAFSRKEQLRKQSVRTPVLLLPRHTATKLRRATRKLFSPAG
jgi:hypothetical protein